jgi:hypothetical protein
MVFAQLTYRESLRDIEACLGAIPERLYHMGIRGPVSRSTLADANEKRNWRIYADFAQVLIAEARRLYANEPLDADLERTVYALDSSTIELCLSLFPWAKVEQAGASVKLQTLLDLRGSIPVFAHVSGGRFSDLHVLEQIEVEPGLDLRHGPPPSSGRVGNAVQTTVPMQSPAPVSGPPFVRCGTGNSLPERRIGVR